MKINLELKSKTLTASAVLRGETGPIEVRARYDLRENGGGCLLRVDEVEFDREWMTILARRFAVGREIELPRALVGCLELFEE